MIRAWVALLMILPLSACANRTVDLPQKSEIKASNHAPQIDAPKPAPNAPESTPKLEPSVTFERAPTPGEVAEILQRAWTLSRRLRRSLGNKTVAGLDVWDEHQQITAIQRMLSEWMIRHGMFFDESTADPPSTQSRDSPTDRVKENADESFRELDAAAGDAH